MNNEYESGRYGQYLKYFQNNEDYIDYKDSSITIKWRPNVSWVEDVNLVNYNWEEIDDNSFVLTQESNSVLWNLLTTSSINPSSPEGFTKRDLASITLDMLYDREGGSGGIYNEDIEMSQGWGELSPEQRENIDFNDIGKSIFYMFGFGDYCLNEPITYWEFPEFRYFTSITEIPREMFTNCIGLTSITLPSTITSIGYYAFHDCRFLEEITLLSTPEFDVNALAYAGWDIFHVNAPRYSNCQIKCSEAIYNYYNSEGNIIEMNNICVLWSDLSVYTVNEIINDVPQSGYPIGINMYDNKYISLKYMSLNNPDEGSSSPSRIIFGRWSSSGNNPTENNIQVQTDITDPTCGYCSATINSEDKLFFTNESNNFYYFNGKQQTQRILNNVSNNGYKTSATISSTDDYPAAECTWRFNPGNTNQGDWYLPEIGELMYVYYYQPAINYICNILYNKGYDVYQKISYSTYDEYWSSTFLMLSTNSNAGTICVIIMNTPEIEVDQKNSDWATALAMYELPQPGR